MTTPTTKPPATIPTSVVLAQRAFEAFVKAVTTGDSAPLMALMHPQVRFWVPLPFADWQGEQRGAARVAELVAFERDVMQMSLRFEQVGLVAGSHTAGVEFRVQGRHRGGDYHNHLSMFFEFDAAGLITAWREYTGEVDPKAVAAVTQNAEA